MERLAEQIVAWHNRHPLARRIAVGDVHTVGVVALPFVRASAEAGGLVEPVLTDAVTFDELAAAPRQSAAGALAQRLRGLVRALRLPGAKPRTQWRAFSERFLPGLSPGRVERFALAHGFMEPPATPETRPWRVIVIDEAVASQHSGWPFEIYLMTAGIDQGSKRTRVLAGRGIPSEITGRRLWDPRRLGAAAALLLVLAGGSAWLLRPTPKVEVVPEPAAAASAPIAPPASAPGASAPDAALPASAPASGPEGAASAASAAQAAASEPDPDAPPPDIRPRLVERTDGIKRPPLLRSKPVEERGSAGDKPARQDGKTEGKADVKAAEAKPEPADTRLVRMAKSPDKVVVALVGPPGTKAEAEALLKKMQASLEGVHGDPDTLQADVIQTPEGWRATVWPFASREQAQLINATLVARGFKTKAVNF
ncbi:MAG: hypothetical protein JNL93_17875 [Pelomonas sp.]|nr:hypothetical protein [Roseateles sp.]